MAKQLRQTPSEIYRIEDELTAWSFDRAVLTFGNALESKLQSIARKSKNQAAAEQATQMELQRWLSSADPGGANVKGVFRDPAVEMAAAGATRRVKRG